MDSQDPWLRYGQPRPERRPDECQPPNESPTAFPSVGDRWPEEHGRPGVGGTVPALLVGAMLLGLVLVAAVAWHVEHRWMAADRLPPAVEEPAEEKFRRAAEAFSGKPVDGVVPPDHPDHRELTRIHALFETLGKVLPARDMGKMEELFHFDRMWEEVRRQAPDVRLTTQQERDARTGFQHGLLRGYATTPAGLAHARFEVRNCRFDDNGKQAVVYVRYWNEVGLSGKSRWWLTRQGEQWLVYDTEDLTISARMTTINAMFLPVLARGGPLSFDPNLLTQLLQALSEEDWPTAEALLERLDFSRAPELMQAVHWMLQAGLNLAYERFEHALEACDRAEALHPDMPVLNLQRAAALNGLGRHEEARQHAQKYLDLLGADSVAFNHLGNALFGLDRPEEAIEAYRRALDDEPNAYDCLLSLAYLLPEDRQAEVAERFARFREPEQWFDRLCGDLTGHGNDAAVQAVVAAYGAIRPDDPDVAYYSAWVLLQREQYEAAAEKLSSVFRAVQGRDDETAFVNLYLDAMTGAGRVLDGYRNAPDPGHAFEYLATAALDEQRVDDLTALLETHREAQPHNPWLLYYSGGLARLEGDWQTAIACYRSGWQTSRNRDDPEDYTADLYRDELIGAMYAAGRPFDAYAELEPRDEVFRQLAFLFEADEDAGRLSVLIDAHRLAGPDDPALDLWNVRLLFLKQEYAAAIQAIDELRRANGERRQMFDDWRWWMDDALVRSHIHLEQFDEALTLARDAAARHENPRFHVLAHAGRRDATETLAWLDRCAEQGHWIESFYFDDVVGPALRSDAFAPVREKYPEPELEEEPEPEP